MTIDGHRPDGAFGDVIVDGRGRDLVTPVAGVARIAATERVHLRADFVSDQAIQEIDAEPGDPGLEALRGLSSRRGFRAAVAARMPHRADEGSLLLAILNDVPIVTSLSRIALRRRGAISFLPSDPNFLGNRGTVGAAWSAERVECAGWAPDTTMSRRAAAGLDPTVGDSAHSPPIWREDDDVAWHAVPALPPDGFRRWRRIDLWRRTADPALIDVDGWWRDTYVAEDATLRIVHEYSVNLTVDGGSLTVLASVAAPRVLPAPECNRASATADRLVGRRLGELGAMVREELTGFSTCTHLNDEIRCLADVASLISILPPT